jgi:hypothetical protein
LGWHSSSVRESGGGEEAGFVPLASWDDFEAYGVRELEDLKQLFHFACDRRALFLGWCYGERDSKDIEEGGSYREGDGGNHEMVTAEKYFRTHFNEIG